MPRSPSGSAVPAARSSRGGSTWTRSRRRPRRTTSPPPRAPAEARGAVVAFRDDDAVPRAGWRAALLAAYERADVACAGGRILLHFAAPPPAWLTPPLYPALSGYDAGDGARRLRDRPGDEYPYGANISFRVASARALGGFSTHLGPRGRLDLVHDETDLCYRIDHAGGEIHYVPDAIRSEQ